MDIKLKNNKKTINRKFLIISLCIAILPILLGLSSFSTDLLITKNILHEKYKIYDKYVPNLMKSIAYIDENGNIREDVIAKETD